MRHHLLASAAALALAAATTMPAGASSVSLSCITIIGTTPYTGTVQVDGSRLATLQVGQVITYRNGLSGTITSVDTDQWTGTASLPSGETASVTCTR